MEIRVRSGEIRASEVFEASISRRAGRCDAPRGASESAERPTLTSKQRVWLRTAYWRTGVTNSSGNYVGSDWWSCSKSRSLSCPCGYLRLASQPSVRERDSPGCRAWPRRHH